MVTGRHGKAEVARAHPGVNSHLVADDGLLDALSGTAVLNGIPVDVAPASPGPALSRESAG